MKLSKKAFFRVQYGFSWASIIFSKEFYAYLTVPALFSTQTHRQINSYSSVNHMVATNRAPEAISVCFFQKNPLKHNIFCLPKL
jgi:hypothetical protein